jgi:hypothetical protein
MSRRGVSANGEPGVRVQVILAPETIEQLDQFREGSRLGRGPAVRTIVAGLFEGNEWLKQLFEGTLKDSP